jgi:PAS domain-containing protein
VLASHGIDLKEYELDGMPCQQVYLPGPPASFLVNDLPSCTGFPRGRVTTPSRCRSQRPDPGPSRAAVLRSERDPNLDSVLTTFSMRMVAELERLQSDAQLRLSAVAFETHEGIIITDPEFKILRVNHAFSQITGFDSQRVIGLHLGNDLWCGLGGLATSSAP